MFAVAKRTASMDLGGLVAAGLFERLGFTGKGVFYRLAKGAMKGQKGQRPDNSKGQQTGNWGVAEGPVGQMGQGPGKAPAAPAAKRARHALIAPRRKAHGKGAPRK